jgi:DNA polymerase I
MVGQGDEKTGVEISVALDYWLKFKHIEKLLSTYIKPLQGQINKNGRIHCSMNLNTETGRISCKKPNL